MNLPRRGATLINSKLEELGWTPVDLFKKIREELKHDAVSYGMVRRVCDGTVLPKGELVELLAEVLSIPGGLSEAVDADRVDQHRRIERGEVHKPSALQLWLARRILCTCDICGGRYPRYYVKDSLWESVMGKVGGLRCTTGRGRPCLKCFSVKLGRPLEIDDLEQPSEFTNSSAIASEIRKLREHWDQAQ